jgi:hypothetical protein
MRIILDIYEGEDGRPAGSVRAEGQLDGRSFSGNLEFLALVESLYLSDANTSSLNAPGTRECDGS